MGCARDAGYHSGRGNGRSGAFAKEVFDVCRSPLSNSLIFAWKLSAKLEWSRTLLQPRPKRWCSRIAGECLHTERKTCGDTFAGSKRVVFEQKGCLSLIAKAWPGLMWMVMPQLEWWHHHLLCRSPWKR